VVIRLHYFLTRQSVNPLFITVSCIDPQQRQITRERGR